MQLLPEGSEVLDRLDSLLIGTRTRSPNIVSKELAFGHQELRFLAAVGESRQDGLVKERL